jgi:hypothetical protein
MLMACSSQKKIAKTFNGHMAQELLEKYGQPTNKMFLKDGGQIWIYSKTREVGKTRMATDRHTPQGVEIPGFMRSETYRFTISKDGKIIDTKYEEQTIRK